MSKQATPGEGLTTGEMNTIMQNMMMGVEISVEGPDVIPFVADVAEEMLEIAKNGGTVGMAPETY